VDAGGLKQGCAIVFDGRQVIESCAIVFDGRQVIESFVIVSVMVVR
jgi:hypothetical protein